MRKGAELSLDAFVRNQFYDSTLRELLRRTHVSRQAVTTLANDVELYI